LPRPVLAGRRWRLRDLFTDQQYIRYGDELTLRGLYIDRGPWGFHVFDITSFPE
jgi:hypothetical protein